MSDVFDFGQFLAAGTAANNENPVSQSSIDASQNITYLTEGFNPNSRINYVGDSAINDFSHENFSDKTK